MKKIMFDKAVGNGGIRNWSGVLKFQRPLNIVRENFDYELLYYDKDREHQGLYPLGLIPKIKDRKYVFNHIFHGEAKTYWLVHIKDGVWNFASEVDDCNW